MNQKKDETDLDTDVEVCIRVRPTYGEESDCVVFMDTLNKVMIQNQLTKTKYSFVYDYTFWSYDHCEKYIDQKKLYSTIGKKLIGYVFQGYNVTLFAYGQTGSGKTYTVFGPPERKKVEVSELGLLPRVCKGIFRRIKEQKKKDIEWFVSATAVEIYNNKVVDLNNIHNPLNKTGLRVRENINTGPYVEGVKEIKCKGSKSLLATVQKANEQRVTLSTDMNDFSSRSHLIIQIIMKRVKNASKQEDLRGEKTSIFSIIDLAGSARNSDKKERGQLLVERTSINVSLTHLGRLIDKLTDKDRTEKTYIPYRDNKLTWLLKEALSGNSKTMLICTISPASLCIEETLSTLRFAVRMKKVKTRAKLQEDSNVYILIEELKQTIIDLRKKIMELEKENKSLLEEIAKFKSKKFVDQEKFLMEEVRHKEEINILKKNMENLNTSIKMLQERKKAKDDEEKLKNFEIENLSTNLKKIQTQLLEKDKFYQLKMDQTKVESDNMIVGLNSKLENSDKQLKELKELLGQKNGELETIKKQFSDFQMDNEKKMLKEIQKNEKKELKINELSDQLQNILKTLEKEKNVRSGVESGLQQALKELEDTKTKSKDFNSQNTVLNEKINNIISANNGLKKDNSFLKNQLVELRLNLENVSNKTKEDNDNFQKIISDLKINHENEKVQLEKEKTENETELLDNYKRELEKVKNQHLREKDALEREKQRELSELRNSFELEKEKMKGNHQGDIEDVRSKIKIIEGEKLALLKQLQIKQDEEKAMLQKNNEMVNDLQMEISNLKKKCNDEINEINQKSKERINALEDEITRLKLENEKEKLTFSKSKKVFEEKLLEEKQKFEEKYRDMVKEKEKEIEAEKKKLLDEMKKLEILMKGKYENSQIENGNMKNQFDLKEKLLREEFEKEKKKILSDFENKIERFNIDKEREIQKLQLSNNFEKEELQRQIQSLNNQFEDFKKKMESLLKEKEEILQKLKKKNEQLVSQIFNWIGKCKANFNNSFTEIEAEIISSSDKNEDENHHESKCSNLLNRDPTLVWFTDIKESLPQSVIFKFDVPKKLKRVGIFIHGENNQNPAQIYVSKNEKDWVKIVDDELEHRAKDFLYDVDENNIQFIKYTVTKNFGGSGIHISKVFAFGL